MLFSIIMPVYNAEKTLVRSVESVLKQTVEDFELIVVDDGSSDGSWRLIEKYAKGDKRIVAIHQDNVGPGMARNHAISISTGEYIAFLDADDYWELDFLETIIRASDDKRADLIFAEIVREDKNGNVIKYLNVKKNRNLEKKEMICGQIAGKLPWGISKVIKRNLVKQTANGFLTLDVGEEAIFSYEVLKNAQYVAFADKVIYHYVQNNTGQHTKGDCDPWKPLLEKMKEHLIAKGEYAEYEVTVNSLALKALTICVYRCSCLYERKMAIKQIKQFYDIYSNQYDLTRVNVRVLDKRTIVIMICLKVGLFSLLYYASKIRKDKMKRTKE